MTRPTPTAERRKPTLPLSGKVGAMLIGAVALMVLQPGAERLWNRLQAPVWKSAWAGPAFR